jgi:uncharacterized protein YutE (UPF0331/DUF86 family)
VVDKPKLDQMLTSLGRYSDVLQRLSERPTDAFLANPDQIGNAKYHLVIAIECCIDIANHIIASENLRFPKDNADSFVVLTEHGILDPGMKDALRAMARFRNRLVHLYWDVEDARVHEYLRDSLGDLRAFAHSIAARKW